MCPASGIPSRIRQLEDAFRDLIEPIQELDAAQQPRFERLKEALGDAAHPAVGRNPEHDRAREVIEPILQRLSDYQRSLPAFDAHLLGHVREMEIEASMETGSNGESTNRTRDILKDFYSTHLTLLQILERISALHSQMVDEVERRFREMGELLGEQTPKIGTGGLGLDQPRPATDQAGSSTSIMRP